MANRIWLSEKAKDHLARWYGEEFLDEVILLEGSVLGWLFGLSRQHAVTVNKTVHLTSHAPDLASDRATVLIGHECFHIQQQQDTGWWRYLLKYVWGWRPSHVRKGRTHPLEKPAYERGDEIRAALRGL